MHSSFCPEQGTQKFPIIFHKLLLQILASSFMCDLILNTLYIYSLYLLYIQRMQLRVNKPLLFLLACLISLLNTRQSLFKWFSVPYLLCNLTTFPMRISYWIIQCCTNYCQGFIQNICHRNSWYTHFIYQRIFVSFGKYCLLVFCFRCLDVLRQR